MIRLCAHSFGCLNLIGWVYKWEYIPNLRWFLVMWTMNISLSNLISTWTNGDATMTAFHQMSEPDRQHAMKSLTVFLLHIFLQFCICFLDRVNIQSMQGCSTFFQYNLLLSLKSQWRDGSWRRFYHSSCCCACDRSMVAILPFIQTILKQKHKQRKENTDLTKKFTTKIARQISSKHKQNLESNAAV